MRMAREAFSSLSSKIVKVTPSLSVAQRRQRGESARYVPMFRCGLRAGRRREGEVTGEEGGVEKGKGRGGGGGEWRERKGRGGA